MKQRLLYNKASTKLVRALTESVCRAVGGRGSRARGAVRHCRAELRGREQRAFELPKKDRAYSD